MYTVVQGIGAHLDEIPQNDVPMRLENRKRNKENESSAVVVRPEHLPQSQNVLERKLALERDENPSTFCVASFLRETLGVCTHLKQKNKLSASVFSMAEGWTRFIYSWEANAPT